MASRKDMAGKDKEPQVRGKAGPASATKNEKKRKGRGDAGADAGRVPKVGKREAAKGGPSGDGLH